MSFIWLKATWLEAVSRCENQTSREIPIEACAVGVNSREIFSPFLRVQNRLVSSLKVIRICSIVVIALKRNASKWFLLVEMLLEYDSVSYIHIRKRGDRPSARHAASLSIFPNEWRSVSQKMLPYASSDIRTACVALGLWLRPVCLNCAGLA